MSIHALAPVVVLGVLSSAWPQAGSDTPTARIDFPLPSALTDAETIRVRGSASDADGIAAVRVNGVPASTVDGFATWWAVVPLRLGENELVVEAVDAVGIVVPDAWRAIVHREAALIAYPNSIAVDPATQTLWMADIAPQVDGGMPGMRVQEIDLLTRAREVLSSRAVGDGPLPDQGWLDFDPHESRLLCLDTDGERLLAIDLSSGDRVVISGASVGGGPALVYPTALAVDPAQPRAFIVQWGGFGGDAALLEVDLHNGDRTLVSSALLGDGPWGMTPNGVCILPGSARALVVFDGNSGTQKSLVGVDLESGDRALVADGSLGPSAPWAIPRDVLALDGGTALIADVSAASYGRILAVDLAQGVLREVASHVSPAGPLFAPEELALDALRQRAFLVDGPRSCVMQLELATGALHLIARSSAGSGPVLGKFPRRPRIDVRHPERAYVLDTEFGMLTEILWSDSGSRSHVSGPGVGSGPIWSHVVDHDLIIDVAGTTSLVLDNGGKSLFAVDVASGERKLVSGPGLGSGQPFAFPWQVAVVDRDRAIVHDDEFFFSGTRLLDVNLSTGDRFVLSGPGIGSGPRLGFIAGIAVDPAGNRALVAAAGNLLEVDLTSGDRKLLSGDGAGFGPDVEFDGSVIWDRAGARAIVRASEVGVVAVDGSTGDRQVLLQPLATTGPGVLAWSHLALARPEPDGEAMLVYLDGSNDALGVTDLWAEPGVARNPAWRAIVSR